jgi:hypothetical protein
LLHGIRNGFAEEGEVLVVLQFFTGSKGVGGEFLNYPKLQGF